MKPPPIDAAVTFTYRKYSPILRCMEHLQQAPAIDWTACPLIEINPEKVSGVPILKGTRMPADAILENYADGLMSDEIAEVFQLPAESVRGLLAYAMQHDPALRP